MALQNALSMSAWAQGTELAGIPGGADGLLASLAASGLPGVSSIPTPRTFTLLDRQVYVSTDDVNLYSLCRKWVQNLPEEEVPIPEPACFQLPPPQAPDVSANGEQQAPPTYSDPFTQQKYEAEEALRLMKAHWISVRQHFQAGMRERAQRQQQRLVPWLSAATLPLVPSAGLAAGVPDFGALPAADGTVLPAMLP